jgi:hypothetical protein
VAVEKRGTGSEWMRWRGMGGGKVVCVVLGLATELAAAAAACTCAVTSEWMVERQVAPDVDEG